MFIPAGWYLQSAALSHCKSHFTALSPSGITFYSAAFRLSFRHSLRFAFRDGVSSGQKSQGISCDQLRLDVKSLTFQGQD
jgi:hypothetical protein